MSFRIRRHETVPHAVRRIAKDQIDRAIKAIDCEGDDRVETVHQVRKHCKMIRGLIRLVRPAFQGTYRRENLWYRDTARLLSEIRNADSSLECLAELAEHHRGQAGEELLVRIRERFIELNHHACRTPFDAEQPLREFRRRMQAGRRRVTSWKIPDRGWKTISTGLRFTYQRCRVTMKSARSDASEDNLHEWRKCVKDHWYHSRILTPIWPEEMEHRCLIAGKLAEDLGRLHDLSLLRQILRQNSKHLCEAADRKPLRKLIQQRHTELCRNAFSVGRRLFGEKPKQMSKRFRVYWNAWQQEPSPEMARTDDSALLKPDVDR
ncbi:MAG: CHAD domain-containing protein [Planctomycetaceae bacterium]